MPACRPEPEPAGTGVGVGETGVVFNAPVGEREVAERGTGDALRGVSTIDSGGGCPLKACIAEGGGPGGGA